MFIVFISLLGVMSGFFQERVLSPLVDAFKLRFAYFQASLARWAALALLIAIGVTMLAMDEMNLTGTRWAAFLPLFGGYIMARLSTGVALFDHSAHAHKGNSGLNTIFINNNGDDDPAFSIS